MNVRHVDSPTRARWAKFVDAELSGPEDARAARARRVVLALVLIWILNAFDLTFTVLAHRIGGLKEMNPFAGHLLTQSGGLIPFKAATVIIGSGILFVFRRRWTTEAAAWGVCAVYLVLAFMWVTYYELPLR